MRPAPASGPSPHAVSGEVYVVDDDDALRQAIERLLRRADFLVRTYGSAEAFLQEAPRLSPGCVLADLRMPGMDGLELVRRIAASGRPFRTVIVTGNADVGLAVDVMKSGATDVIQKPFDGDALLVAVRLALDRLAAAGDEHRSLEQFREALSRTTPRERDVLRGVVAGKTNKHIARDLQISPRTVEAHRANLMKKMGVETLSDLVRITLLADERGRTRPANGSHL